MFINFQDQIPRFQTGFSRRTKVIHPKNDNSVKASIKAVLLALLFGQLPNIKAEPPYQEFR